MTICLCFWDNHLGSNAIKKEEKLNTTDEHSVSEKLDLVKEVKPTHQGTNNRMCHIIVIRIENGKCQIVFDSVWIEQI